MKIEFSDEQLVALYRTGGDEARKAIKEALGDEFSELIPVTKRVQTLDDAVRELGVARRNIAFVTLRVITEALNEGWKPQFTEGERRWYAWYDFLTKEEVEGMSDEEKEERRVVGRAGSYAYGGLVYSHASHVSTHSYTDSGSRLAFKNEELAEYAAKQFGDIYADFCFIPKAACKNEEA